MTDIDLIPADYRAKIKLIGRVKLAVVVVAMSLAASLAGYLTFDHKNKILFADIAALQNQQQISTQQSELLTALTNKKNNFENQLSLLGKLRNGMAAPAMFTTVDRALVDNKVWFLDWEFQRAGHVVNKKPQTVSSGYFIVVQGNNAAAEEAWMIETHMTIHGQAQDHAALSQFVGKLFKQPEIHDVRILNTSRQPTAGIINFDLAVTVDNAAANG